MVALFRGESVDRDGAFISRRGPGVGILRLRCNLKLASRPKPRIPNPESSYNQLVAQVLLAGKDWQARALVRAQLLEDGVGVEAFETVREALAQLEFFPVRPALLIADIAASDHPSADVDSLANWARRLPIWIIASHTSRVPGGLDGRGFEKLLFRPVDMGKLIEQIRERLAGK